MVDIDVVESLAIVMHRAANERGDCLLRRAQRRATLFSQEVEHRNDPDAETIEEERSGGTSEWRLCLAAGLSAGARVLGKYEREAGRPGKCKSALYRNPNTLNVG